MFDFEDQIKGNAARAGSKDVHSFFWLHYHQNHNLPCLPNTMHTQAQKPSGNKSEAASLNKSAHQEFAFSDNRAGTQALKEVLAMRYTDPQVPPFEEPAAQPHEASLKTGHTGLPAGLMAGIENLSGISMSAVQVHYNSAKPAQLQAHAYTQGTDIHIGPGQEKHLPHEAWHVVQQQQRRVKPTLQAKSGEYVNDDNRLEKEADVMGARAARWKGNPSERIVQKKDQVSGNGGITVLQCCFSNNLPDAETFRLAMGVKPEALTVGPKGSQTGKNVAIFSAIKPESKQESTDVKDNPVPKPADTSVARDPIKPAMETTVSSGLTVTTAGEVESKTKAPGDTTKHLASARKTAPAAGPEQFLTSICRRLPRYHQVRNKIKLSDVKKGMQQADKKELKEDQLKEDLLTLMQLNDELEHDAYGYMVSNAAALYLDKEPAGTSEQGATSESKAKALTTEEREALSHDRRMIQMFLNALQDDHTHIVEKLLEKKIGTLHVALDDDDPDHKRKAEELWNGLSKNFDAHVRISHDPDLKLKGNEFSNFKKNVKAMFAKLLTRPAGRDLVQKLIEKKNVINIELGEVASTLHTKADSRGVNTGGIITMTLIDLKTNYQNTAQGKEGRLPFPAFLTLAHEMAHLLHHWTGLVDYTKYKDPEVKKQYSNPEERSTIEHENLIRAEHGLGTRTRHAHSKEDEDEGCACCVKCVVQ